MLHGRYGHSETPTGAADNLEAIEAGALAGIARGDRRAFERLYRAYFPRLTRFLGRMSYSRSLVEEVLDDTMMVVWGKAHSYDRSCKVSTWIFAIAYRKALKAMKAGRLLNDPVDIDFNRLEDEAAAGPEREAMAFELRRDVGRALDALSLEQRTVVELTYYQGMSYEEIASIVDCPLNTVKTRMFHARRRLKTLLAGRMGDDRERTYL